MPTDAPTGSSALLKADRQYQLAAAQFYAAQFDLAILCRLVGPRSRSATDQINETRSLKFDTILPQAVIRAGTP
jgi:hypothetical protein